MNTPLFTTDTSVVRAVLQLFNISDEESLLTASAALCTALRKSMTQTTLYGNASNSMSLNADLIGDQVHPYNIGMALHILRASAPAFGIFSFIPSDLQVWTGEWTRLDTAAFVPEFALSPPPPIAPIIPEAAIAPPLVNPTPIAAAPQVNPGVYPIADSSPTPGTPSPEDALAAAMRALEGSAPTPTKTAEPPATTSVAQKTMEPSATAQQALPFISSYTQHPLLPSVVLTAEPQGTAGRPQKSPFEKTLKPRAKIGSAPAWWEDFERMAKNVFATPPVSLVAPDNTTEMMTFGLTLRVANMLLSNAHPDVTVAELREWITEVEDRLSVLPADAVAYDLINNFIAP